MMEYVSNIFNVLVRTINIYSLNYNSFLVQSQKDTKSSSQKDIESLMYPDEDWDKVVIVISDDSI